MPQKGQITKHEWKNFTVNGVEIQPRSYCIHCKVERFIDLYLDTVTYYRNEKPSKRGFKCITRKIQADEKQGN